MELPTTFNKLFNRLLKFSLIGLILNTCYSDVFYSSMEFYNNSFYIISRNNIY